jgi:hypothetical protein
MMITSPPAPGGEATPPAPFPVETPPVPLPEFGGLFVDWPSEGPPELAEQPIAAMQIARTPTDALRIIIQTSQSGIGPRQAAPGRDVDTRYAVIGDARSGF